MNNLGGIICGICLSYYLEPVTAKCSHSFCQFCIEKYFLQFSTCPICQQQIRKNKLYPARSLHEFTENFIDTQDPQYLNQYLLRKLSFKNWKQSKQIKQISAGMNIDIRDEDYHWHEGQVIRIISRVGETHKFLKIRFSSSSQKQNQTQKYLTFDKQEDIVINSQKLAPYGFFTKKNSN